MFTQLKQHVLDLNCHLSHSLAFSISSIAFPAMYKCCSSGPNPQFARIDSARTIAEVMCGSSGSACW